jgi:urease accessory protein
MLRLIAFAEPDTDYAESLTLPYAERQKSRARVRLDGGGEAGIFLQRGDKLRDGDRLRAEDGSVVLIKAAPEALSVVRTEDALLFARACYHLGNRHVALQIIAGELRYLHDHVLDDMVRGLGLAVSELRAPFEPESGAYHGQGHAHAH